MCSGARCEASPKLRRAHIETGGVAPDSTQRERKQMALLVEEMRSRLHGERGAEAAEDLEELTARRFL